MTVFHIYNMYKHWTYHTECFTLDVLCLVPTDMNLICVYIPLSLCFSVSSLAMSKVAVKKLHWRSKVQEIFVPLVGSSGELGIAIGGGADYGEFPFVTAAPGGGITVGDIILEIGGTPVLGLTLGDVRGLLNSCPHPIRIKTVSPGIVRTVHSQLSGLNMDFGSLYIFGFLQWCFLSLLVILC